MKIIGGFKLTTLQEKLYTREIYAEKTNNRVYFTFKNTGIPNNMKLVDFTNKILERENTQLIHTVSGKSHVFHILDRADIECADGFMFITEYGYVEVESDNPFEAEYEFNAQINEINIKNRSITLYDLDNSPHLFDVIHTQIEDIEFVHHSEI